MSSWEGVKHPSKTTTTPPPPPLPQPLGEQESPNISTMSELTLPEDEDDEDNNNNGVCHSPDRQQQQQQQQHRNSNSSLMEYSDTSNSVDDMLLWQQQQQQQPPTAQSEFRYRQDNFQPSMRMVRFTNSPSSLSEDEEQQQQQRIVTTKTKSNTKNNNINNRSDHSSGGSSRHRDRKKRASTNKERHHHHSHHHHNHNNNNNNNVFGNGWISQLAYSFRSPAPPPQRKRADKSGIHRSASDEHLEYPHHASDQCSTTSSDVVRCRDVPETALVEESGRGPFYPPRSHSLTDLSETSPLLGASLADQNLFRKSNELLFVPVADDIAHRKTDADYLALSASFLQDYEAGRAPTLSKNFAQVSPQQIRLYQYKYSSAFVTLLVTATFCFFLSCLLEGFDASHWHRPALTLLNFFGIAVFAVDIWFRHAMRGNPARIEHTRTSRSEMLVKPVLLLCIVLSVENLARVTVTDDSIVMFSSLFKPLFLFYVSTRARDALEALRRIIRLVLRVIIMELLLILIFAAVATRLFRTYDSFEDLSTAWLSLFELGTTVINPSVWLPMYHEASASAIFFVFYIVTAVFYLHSLVLSVVFQTYIQAASEIHDRNASDREDAVQLAYFALQRKGGTKNTVVYVQDVRQVLRLIRPHYNAMKINALVEIVDPSNQQTIDLATFRTKIRQALNASIRTARSATTLALLVELTAVAVAVVNFVYVILVSSRFSVSWFDSIQIQIGAFITLVGGFELLLRFNPMRIPDFTPLTRLNPTFDGLALLAAFLSIVGVALYLLGRPMSLEYILMGRAVDMIRIMRFFQIFRDIVQRSSEVFPALAGPSILVAASIHLFVYFGMALWGGAVEVGDHPGEIEDLYDLNNFNSYAEGAVTMFQVLVVNDWHAVAKVFLFAERCSSPYIVFPFFIAGNLVGVSIMLNVLTAFFVESFVTKMEEKHEGEGEVATTTQKERNFSLVSERPLRRVTSTIHDSDSEGDIDSESSSDLYEFDVFERQGFDTIMQAVSGAQSPDFAQQICGYLEIFESLSPGRESVGYLICDQSTLDRFGNHRFRTKAAGFLRDDELNIVVSDMHSELMALSSRVTFKNDRALVRTFPHKMDQSKVLEISAALLQQQPAISIFVSRTRREPGPASPPPIPE